MRDPPGVLVWLGGAVVLHDALIAPLVLLIGWVLVRGGVRGTVRGALLVAGALTAVALPVLLRPGKPANSSVLPLDYPSNWLLTMVAVAVAMVTALLPAARRTRRSRQRPPSQGPVHALASGRLTGVSRTCGSGRVGLGGLMR
ncbi:hypothetical protein [Streptomyces sp. NPDC056188]|uniref:hypothetical protein n=1 Tax=Streptomyces sp. NPDC056188 TaxID=3345740 RepID=UPI0035D81905